MKVLVTGASGYIGGNLLAALAGRGELYGTSRTRGDGNPGTDVHWLECDLLKAGAAEALIARWRPDVLVHAAWHTKAGSYWEDRDNFDWLAASERLLEAFVAAGGRRFVGIGSCAEYAATDGPCEEGRTPLTTESAYSASKARFFARLEAERAAGRVETAYARLFFVYGPGEKPTRLIPSVITRLLSGEPAHCGPGELRRDFIHIRDTGEALARLALGKLAGPINIGSGEATRIGDIVARLGALTGRPDLLRVGALPPRASEPDLLLADTTRMGEELHYRLETSLSQGLEEYVEWCHNHSERP
jgi:nucleoside-diphosphate-sugar epimerase